MGFFLIFLTLVFVFYGIVKNSNPILINNNDIIYDDFKNNKKDEFDYEDKIKINNFIINDNDNEINNKNKEEEEENEK